MSDQHYCIWRYDDQYDRWDTGCEESFVFIDGGPDDNGFKFCPYCAGGIIEDRREEA